MSEKNRKRADTRETFMQMLFQMEVQADFSDAAKESFLESFAELQYDADYLDAAFGAYIKNNNTIDELIEKFSRGWRIERLAKVDLSVLRVCISEILFMAELEIPRAVAINEAVRIAKKYSGEDSGRFVNGILGKLEKEYPDGYSGTAAENFEESFGAPIEEAEASAE